MVVLRAQGAIAHVMVSSKPVDEELRRYDVYMAHVRGLAPKTREAAAIVISVSGSVSPPSSRPQSQRVTSRQPLSFEPHPAMSDG
jgi:hypothetical protein